MTCPRCGHRAFYDGLECEHWCLICGWREPNPRIVDILRDLEYNDNSGRRKRNPGQRKPVL